jgi:23S rRNA (uracil1939-C5)-methyltransferase
MIFEKNQLITLDITDLSHEGEGIGKVDGFAFFVKDAIHGDKVTAKVMKTKKTYGYARLEEVLEPSGKRVEPVCPYHKACGGCQLQSMSYEHQLQFKQEKVYNNLLRIGGLPCDLLDETMEPIVGMDEPFHYRNKAQYPVGRDKEGNPITGFYAGRTHSIIANTECYLGRKENRDILERVLAYMKANKISAYPSSVI